MHIFSWLGAVPLCVGLLALSGCNLPPSRTASAAHGSYQPVTGSLLSGRDEDSNVSNDTSAPGMSSQSNMHAP